MDTITTPDTITGDDAMAYGFFARAATAIVRASEYGYKLGSLEGSFRTLERHASTLETIRRNQDEEIATLRAQVESLRDAEATRTAELVEARETIDLRQRDIDLLDNAVSHLNNDISMYRAERDDALAKVDLQGEALNKVIGMLNDVKRALGQPDLDPDPREEIEEACRRPEPEQQDTNHESDMLDPYPEPASRPAYSADWDREPSCYSPDDTHSEPFRVTHGDFNQEGFIPN